jgi:hypothetical protein
MGEGQGRGRVHVDGGVIEKEETHALGRHLD